MSERCPGGGGFGSYGSWRERRERPPRNLREEVERMYAEAPNSLAREVLGMILEKLNAKKMREDLARYIVTADPKDITQRRSMKKLGIFLVHDTFSSHTHEVGDTIIKQGDRVLQIHIPPRGKPGDKNNPLLRDIRESLQLTSDYIKFHGLKPRFITGCSYEPLVSVF